MPLPVSNQAIPSPLEVHATVRNPYSVKLTWDSPNVAYQAVIKRDGTEVGRVNAMTAEYTDSTPKAAGVYTYSLCFARATNLSDPVALNVLIEKPVDHQDLEKEHL